MFVNRTRIAAAALAVGGTLGAGALAPSTASAQALQGFRGTECHAHMHPTAGGAYGGARYEGHHGWREFEINLWGAHRYGGKRVTVTVHGNFVGRMRLSPNGHAYMYRHRGLPRMHAGDMVRVRTKSGKLISYGTFRSMHHRYPGMWMHHHHHHPGMWRAH